MLGILGLAAAVAMSGADRAPKALYPDGAGAYGYTISLVLFALPVAALIIWFSRHRRRIDRHWAAFWITFAVIVGLWSTLDILLARTFFEFPNPNATLGINVIGYDPASGWGGVVPIEEFGFYILGCAFLVLTYIWSSELWFPAYTMNEDEYEEAARATRLGALFHWQTIAVGLGLIVGALILKAWDPTGSAVAGFPGYFTFMVSLVVVPTMMFFHVVLRFVNVRALAFTLQSMLLIALMWEATLALPYGWWDYNHNQMVGVFITPWSSLPIEAVVLWVAATWSNIAIYEVAKLWVHRRRGAPVQLSG